MESPLVLEELKRDPSRVLFETPGASLVDLDDGVLCLEFHSKANALDDGALSVAEYAFKIIPNNYVGLVIGNEGQNFSFGSDLRWLLRCLDESNGSRARFRDVSKRFQAITTGMRTCPFPTVAAPFGVTFGGALELTMYCDRVQTHAKLHARLPEVTLGILPTLGGTSELYARSAEQFGVGNLQDALHFAFDTIVGNKQSTDANDACQKLFLNEHDRMTSELELLIADAKARVLALASGYTAPQHRESIHVLGGLGYSSIETNVNANIASGNVTAYDGQIALAIARVLTGGGEGLPRPVSQEELHQLELECFEELIFNFKTRERIEHILATGIPLRN
jgi:3-hydroxyacyl-CoA dehydrogenase